MIFDTHCHLYDEKFNEDPKKIISRCLTNNVGLLMVVGDNISNSIKCINLANEFDQVYSAIGVHPMEVDQIDLNEIENQINKIINNKVKAIGEIGLDYYWKKDPETKEKQIKYFIKQIEIANKLELPIIIHARDSVEDCIKILKEHECIKKGVFHCFSGSLEQMKEIIKMGFYIGLDGPVTYKNSITPKEVASIVPIDRLVIETDSPYLPPVPFRGQINYPYYLKYVIEQIALIRNKTTKEIEDITYLNGKKLFNI